MFNKKIRFSFLISLMFICFTSFSVKANAQEGYYEGETQRAEVSPNEKNIEIDRELSIREIEDLDKANEFISTIDGSVILSNEGNQYNSYFKLLVPREQEDEIVEEIKTLGNVDYDTINKYGLTKEISDLETTINNQENYKNIIMEMLNQTEDLNTILKFEQYLMEVEVSQTANQNTLYSLTDNSNYTALNLYLEEAYEETTSTKVTDSQSFFKKMENAFKNSFNGTILFFQNVIISLSYLFVPIILFVIVITVIFVIKKGGKKNEKK